MSHRQEAESALISGVVELEIEPEPEPNEREAIETAISRLLGDATLPPEYASAWRRVGIAENVEAD